MNEIKAAEWTMHAPYILRFNTFNVGSKKKDILISLQSDNSILVSLETQPGNKTNRKRFDFNTFWKKMEEIVK